MPGSSAVNVDLTRRSAPVTGAASGIGRAVAERLSRAGAAVTVLDLDGGAAERVAGEIGVEALRADLSDYGVLDSLEFEADVPGTTRAFSTWMRPRSSRPRSSR